MAEADDIEPDSPYDWGSAACRSTRSMLRSLPGASECILKALSRSLVGASGLSPRTTHHSSAVEAWAFTALDRSRRSELARSSVRTGLGNVSGWPDTLRMSSELAILTPCVDPDGVYEIVSASGTVYTVAWSAGGPMLVQRFPTDAAQSMWLDDRPVEFDSLPAFRVGEPVELGDRWRGDREQYSRSSPIVSIRRVEDQ